MTSDIEQRLKDMKIELPQATAPAANYVPAVRSGSYLFTSGQLPFRDGKLSQTGRLGADVSVDEGREAAKWCAVNVLVQAKAELGDLAHIKRIVKLTVFVASAPEFTEQHLVANGASDLLVEALGGAGKHARSAVGMAALPMNATVEVEAILEV